MILPVRKNLTDFFLPDEPHSPRASPQMATRGSPALFFFLPLELESEPLFLPGGSGEPERGLRRGCRNLPARFSPFRGCGKCTLVKPDSPTFICLLTLYPLLQPKARDPSVVIFQLTGEQKFFKNILSIIPEHQIVIP